jgi:GTP-binding protein EngB required for normal cell division
VGFAIRHTSLFSLRDTIEPLLIRIQEICAQFHILSLNREIEACQNLLRQDQLIEVAVLGQFKAGKSSFLNSLIGKPVLPVGVVPVTTTITRLQYGKRGKATVRHYDGKQNEVDISVVEEFTSEAKNPGNHKNVEFVDLELPSLGKYPGLRMVDTPGLGSIFRDHMKTSANWLPEAGTAMVAISSERPLADNDLQLIRDLRRHTPKIVLLLTKADLLDPEQQKEVVQFFRTALQRELHEEFPLFLYSTRLDTDRWKQRLEEEIFRPLSVNREEEFRSILRHKIRSLGKGCLNYLEIALKTSVQADQDREGLRRLILDDKVNYTLIGEELSRIARENARQTRLLILQRLENLEEPGLKRKLAEKLRQEMPSWDGNLWKLTRSYEGWLEENLREELIRISQTESRHFLGTLHKAHAGLSRSLEIFRSLLGGKVEKVLGVKLSETEWEIEIAEPGQPDIKTGRAFDSHLDLIWFLIPMSIFRGLFQKHFMGQIPWEAQVNLARLASQWEDRINRAIEGMKKQALQYVHDELATVEALLFQAGGQTGKIRRTMEELKEEISSRLAIS